MRVRSRKSVAILLGVVGVIASFSVTMAQAVRPLPQPPAGVSAERGKYLVTVMDCNGCHTPFKMGEPDMSKQLSGHPAALKVTAPKLPAGWATAIGDTNTAWSGPWGVSYPTNLTSDRATGVGMWTEAQFLQTIRTGRKGGSGRPLLPPMPWRMYGQLTDDDLKSIFAYLKTVPAISNQVPQAIVAPPPPAAK